MHRKGMALKIHDARRNKDDSPHFAEPARFLARRVCLQFFSVHILFDMVPQFVFVILWPGLEPCFVW